MPVSPSETSPQHTAEIITEKNYPVQGVWLLKSIVLPSAVLIFILVVFFYFSALYKDFPRDILSKYPGSEIYFWLYFAVIPYNFIMAILRRAVFHYSIEDKFLTLRQGILSKQQRHIPYGVIQNIFVKQDLFDRIFGLASLTIENAAQGAGTFVAQGGKKIFGLMVRTQRRGQIEMVGFFGNKGIIPGLTKQNAETLKEIVLRKIKENPIEDSQSGL